MSNDRIEKKLRLREHRYEREQRFLRKRSELDEVLEEVFDQQTLMTIYELMNRGLIKDFYGVVSAGKESRIYYAEGRGGEGLAVKIYLVTSAEFKKSRSMYTAHDPRFQRVPKDFRDFIYLWARREYRNLEEAREAGVPVPRPYFVRNNVLGMEFIGEDEKRYPLLNEVALEAETYSEIYPQVIEAVKRLYSNAKLVHGDLSEYNIFITPDDKIVLIDLSQAVRVEQPVADQLLLRDLRNITRFFGKMGVDVPGAEILFEEITGRKPFEVS
ncbi:MAG: serine protein kinase RIO [Aigarchaeota archaeon]|nr:serine protein kinase RIO [Aigarchaeota archaeon]